MGKVLVAGATGLVGEAAVAAFAARGRDVIAVSRREPEPVGLFEHLAVDLTDAAACQAAFRTLRDVTEVVYAALFEKPGLVAGWREADQMATNLAMIRNLIDPLSKAAPGLRHVTLLQGTKAYGVHVRGRAPLPAREGAPRDEHENFYWFQEDYLRDLSVQQGFAWTIFRPQVIVGAAAGAAMNPLLPIAIYAAMRREEGLPFSYPGGATAVMELVDPRLLGQAFAWAAEAPAASNETFNITNGDVFAWSEVWPAMADALGIEQGPDETIRIAPYILEREALWARIVQKHGLRPVPLERLLGESHHYADMLLRPGFDRTTLPILVSTIKLRRAGFGACYDSEETLRYWLGVMAGRRLIPPLGQ